MKRKWKIGLGNGAFFVSQIFHQETSEWPLWTWWTSGYINPYHHEVITNTKRNEDKMKGTTLEALRKLSGILNEELKEDIQELTEEESMILEVVIELIECIKVSPKIATF